MRIIQNIIDEELKKQNIESGSLVKEDTITELLSDFISKIIIDIRETLEKNAPAMLAEHREAINGFNSRNCARWAAPLDILEKIWVISQETAEEFNNEYADQALQNGDHKFEAIRHIHARSLLIYKEIMCLIMGGYADGALSRWRALHENAVIAVLLSKNEKNISHRYILNFRFSALKAAEQLNKHAECAGLIPISTDKIQEMREHCNELELVHGPEMRNDYGWAFPLTGSKRPKFEDLERLADLEHWRPRYKWSSQHNHSMYRPWHAMLGNCETVEEILLVGPSNSCMVDPMQMAAVTLNIVNACYFMLESTVDHCVIMAILDSYVEEVGPSALRVEKETLEAAKASMQ